MPIRIFYCFAVLLLAHHAQAKKIDKIIQQSEVTRIESALSHDSMEGRKAFTKGVEKAADFISNEMQTIGLGTFQNAATYRQPFLIYQSSIKDAAISFDDGQTLNEKNIICISSQETFSLNEKSGYKILKIAKTDNLGDELKKALTATGNTIVFIDSSFRGSFPRLRRYHQSYNAKPYNIVFVLTPNIDAERFSLTVTQKINTRETSNIIGVLPGKSKADEIVIFSGHYDHLGYSRPDSTGDSLYNGANDDASGITAMLMLAKYYKEAQYNERTILFVAFSAEELGTLGSEYFATTIDVAKVVAMINIEMIGTESKWGKNSFYLTGFERSDLGNLMEKSLRKKDVKVYPDPYSQYQLFYRSDNASLAKLGVPAHTVSSSKMDTEPYYHKPGDEIQTLDMENMTAVTRGIAHAVKPIICGKKTPARIKASN